MTNHILKRFAKKGINLNPTAYEMVTKELSKTEYPDEYLDVLTAIAIYNIKAKGITGEQMLDAGTEILEFERLK